MRRRDFVTLIAGSAVAAWPLAGRAQQMAEPVVGFLSARSAERFRPGFGCLSPRPRRTGYVEGRNVVIEFSWAQGQYDRLPALATELVRRQVAVLATVGGQQSARAAKAATNTIPIIFGIGEDPSTKVSLLALAANANITGATFSTSSCGCKAPRIVAGPRPRCRRDRLACKPKHHPRAEADERRAGSGSRIGTTPCCSEWRAAIAEHRS